MSSQPDRSALLRLRRSLVAYYEDREEYAFQHLCEIADRHNEQHPDPELSSEMLRGATIAHTASMRALNAAYTEVSNG